MFHGEVTCITIWIMVCLVGRNLQCILGSRRIIRCAVNKPRILDWTSHTWLNDTMPRLRSAVSKGGCPPPGGGAPNARRPASHCTAGCKVC